MRGAVGWEFIYASKTVQDVCTNLSYLSNGFKRRVHVNEFKLRRYVITNQNTFRFSGMGNVTSKRRRNCKFHSFSAFKAKHSINVRNDFDSDLF